MRLGLGLILRDGGLSTPCHSCGFACQQKVLKTFPGSGYLLSVDGAAWVRHPLVNLHIWLKSFILLLLNLFGLRVDSGGWWFEHSMSQLRVDLSAEGAKNFFLPWLSPLRGWGSLTTTSTGKTVCMSHHFILLQLNLFGLRVDREGCWFELSMS